MSGLVKLDAYSFTTTLTQPAGYWLTSVALWPFWIVDSKVIATAGDNVWFTNPQTLIGSGPFRMTSRSAGQALDFLVEQAAHFPPADVVAFALGRGRGVLFPLAPLDGRCRLL